MKITQFFENDYNDYAVYDSYRSIASYVDGLKPSARKSIHTVKKRNIKKPYKVAQLVSLISADTQYIHGEQSLNGVVVGLANDYVGTNNIVVQDILNLSEGTYFLNIRLSDKTLTSKFIKW